MISFHKEGKKILLVTTLIFTVLSLSLFFLVPDILYFVLQALLFTATILVFRFFRKPDRNFKADSNSVFAPADGIVVAIEPVFEDEYFRDKRIQVSVFMSIHNVHINWYPIKGSVTYHKYHPGKYLLARHPKSSALNERTTTVIRDGKIEVLVRQIAGYVARRIICYAKQGLEIHPGDELGFIKFGSRVDLLLPENAKIIVEVGDKTTGGISHVATLP